ncbi:XdhC family protein [Novosphingobium huizhouense]|uniref:XdhC family protein n=1 Tax=Novosphingobium huizhouense TaxID=2866625 RepID=UPI001CD86CB9|nr:XdhC family protein [Novosphingobium huizhouense]
MQIAPRPFDLLHFAHEALRNGLAGAFVTLVGYEGAASRGVGSQMVVLTDGRHLGSLSAGCVERAVIDEARAVARSGETRTVRYGAGSPYLDLRLPCGGGIDLQFTPLPAPERIEAALAQLEARTTATLLLGERPCRYPPPLRIVALGHGEDLVALTRTARGLDLAIEAYAPADDLHRDDTIHPLLHRNSLPRVAGDPWTAVVLAFHDRDWEEHLLAQALEIEAFYHGAVGSRRTQRARVAALREAGVDRDRVDRLRGPIGLIPGARDAATLALSIVAEVVQEYHLRARPILAHPSGTGTSSASESAGA